MREDLIKDIKRVIRIIIASLIIAANIKIFVNAGSLFQGGFTGLSILIQRSFDKFLGIKIPYSPVNKRFVSKGSQYCGPYLYKILTSNQKA